MMPSVLITNGSGNAASLLDRSTTTSTTMRSTNIASAVVVYKGPVAGMGDEHGTRKKRFSELDRLQPGWVVELKEKGDGGVVDAVFFAPTTGEKVGAFAAARRMALAHSKAT
jgi:hypothetical protein